MTKVKMNGWKMVVQGIAFLAMVVVFLPSFVLAAAGKAVTNTGSGLSAEFDIEGDLTCGQGGFLKDDWAKKTATTACPTGSASVFTGTGASEVPAPGFPNLASARFLDKAKSSTDDTYGMGSKQNDTSTWTEVINSAPVKSDIGNVYAVARQGRLLTSALVGGAPLTDVLAMMGFERLSANGDTHLDYELNQLPFVTNANGAKVPQRCSFNGQVISGLTCKGPDLLIGVDDGTSKVPTITVYQWTGSPSLGNFVPVTFSSPFTINLGATNSVSIPPGPWGTYNSHGALVNTNILADTFSEVAVDLTLVTGLQLTCPGSFKTIFIKSRASSEVNSALKDRIVPQSFGLDICASMNITKRDASDPKNIKMLAGAVFTITPNPTTGSGSITVTSDVNGIVYNSTSVKPGIYTIHEVSSPLGNVPVGDKTCDVSAFKANCTLVIDNVGKANLTASKSANPTSGSNVVSGQTIAYAIAYGNTGGTAPALNTVITDVVDLNLTNIVPISPGVFNPLTRTITWNVGTVGIAVTGTVSFTATVVSPLANVIIQNKAHVRHDKDASGFDTNTIMHNVGNPNLTLVKSVDKSVASPGNSLVYTLSYANIGQGDAVGVTIADILPAKTTFVSATGGGTFLSGTITWGINTLLHGSSGSVTFTVKLDSLFPAGTTTIPNFGTITGKGLLPKPSNTVTTTVTAAPILTIVKTVDKAMAVPGDLLVYTQTYQNIGNAAANAVVISDIIPPKTTFVSATGGGTFAAGVVTWSIKTVPPGPSASVTFTVKLDAVFPNGTTAVTNVAVISSTELPKPITSNRVTTTVTAAVKLVISKTLTASVNRTISNFTNTATMKSNEKVAAVSGTHVTLSQIKGVDLTYTLSYANDGNANASGVTITDILPAESCFVSASGGGVYGSSGGTIMTECPSGFKGGTVTWLVPSLGSLSSGSFTMSIRVGF